MHQPLMFLLATPLEWIRGHAVSLPTIAKFAVGMAIIVGVPPLSRRIHLPGVVGLLLSGVILGPYCFNVMSKNTPVASFFAELGKLLLMFFAGLEIDLALFREKRNRTTAFGLLTTLIPLILGTGVGLLFGYHAIPAIVLGSLLASHTLLAMPIVTKLGLVRLEPITITVGATVLSDTLSLIVFAICVPVYKSGFSVSGLAIQLLEIAIFFPVVLIGLSRLGAYVLRKIENDEDAYFVLMLAILAIAALIAQMINLPGIVGGFLAGLAVNAAVRDKPAKTKLEFFGNSFFIPIFFVVTGFLINPIAFFHTLTGNFGLAAGVVGALLLGKWIAVQIAGRSFSYPAAARKTMWSLTLPQVAATLAATLVAYETFNSAGQRLVDDRLLNVVLVLVLTTSILGPVLTQNFAPQLRAPEAENQFSKRRAA
jgi:Kef-type K+ transport system membrane component KefB